MKRIYFLLVSLLCFTCIMSCSDDDTVDQIIPDPGSTGEIELKNPEAIQDLVFDNETRSIDVNFKAPAAWNIKIDEAGWIAVRPMSGEQGDASIEVSADINDNYDNRTGRVTISCGKGIKDVSFEVTQVQKDALVLAKDNYAVKEEGGEIKIKVGSNIDYSITIDNDWISQTKTRAFVEKELVFMVAKNNTHAARSGKITFASKDGSLKQEVTIEQEGNRFVTIPDPVFKEYLIKNFDTDSDKELSYEEAQAITQLDLQPVIDKPSKQYLALFNELESLEGIEAMTNLEILWIDAFNPMVETENFGSLSGTLDLSMLPKLQRVGITWTPLDKVIFGEHPAMQDIYLFNNCLTAVELGNLPQMTIFNCAYNYITELDLSHCPELTNLYCGFEAGNIPIRPDFTDYVRGNQLSTLDLSHNPKLKYLDISNNKFESIDLSHNPELEAVWALANKLTTLDVSHNSKLQGLLLGANIEKSVNEQMKTNIGNELQSIILGDNPDLVQLQAPYNHLTKIDVAGAPNLEWLDLSHNDIKDFTAPELPHLYQLIITDNNMETLDMTRLPALERITCNHNKLRSVDLSQNLGLQVLSADFNDFSELDISLNKNIHNCTTTNNLNLKTVWVWDEFDIYAGTYKRDAHTDYRYKSSGEIVKEGGPLNVTWVGTSEADKMYAAGRCITKNAEKAGVALITLDNYRELLQKNNNNLRATVDELQASESNPFREFTPDWLDMLNSDYGIGINLPSADGQTWVFLLDVSNKTDRIIKYADSDEYMGDENQPNPNPKEFGGSGMTGPMEFEFGTVVENNILYFNVKCTTQNVGYSGSATIPLEHYYIMLDFHNNSLQELVDQSELYINPFNNKMLDLVNSEGIKLTIGQSNAQEVAILFDAKNDDGRRILVADSNGKTGDDAHPNMDGNTKPEPEPEKPSTTIPENMNMTWVLNNNGDISTSIKCISKDAQSGFLSIMSRTSYEEYVGQNLTLEEIINKDHYRMTLDSRMIEAVNGHGFHCCITAAELQSFDSKQGAVAVVALYGAQNQSVALFPIMTASADSVNMPQAEFEIKNLGNGNVGMKVNSISKDITGMSILILPTAYIQPSLDQGMSYAQLADMYFDYCFAMGEKDIRDMMVNEQGMDLGRVSVKEPTMALMQVWNQNNVAVWVISDCKAPKTAVLPDQMMQKLAVADRLCRNHQYVPQIAWIEGYNPLQSCVLYDWNEMLTSESIKQQMTVFKLDKQFNAKNGRPIPHKPLQFMQNTPRCEAFGYRE